jgi:hypothetical protein
MKRLATIAALAALLANASGCGSSSHTATREQGAPVAKLQSIDQLRHTFDAHAGEPRLILLISPT